MVQLPPDESNNKSLPITVSLSESEDKARARDLTLLECQQLALEYNFVKENAPSNGTVQQRADVVGFFKQYGANGLSQFKKKFGSMKLYPPGEKEVEFYSSSGSCEDDDLVGSNGDSFLKKPISKEDIEEAIPIYEENKDEDGFLYVQYSGENTFGGEEVWEDEEARFVREEDLTRKKTKEKEIIQKRVRKREEERIIIKNVSQKEKKKKKLHVLRARVALYQQKERVLREKHTKKERVICNNTLQK